MYKSKPFDDAPWLRAAIALEILIIVIWGGGIVALANYASGEFSALELAAMFALWCGLPLLITFALVFVGIKHLNKGNRTLGAFLISLPLIILGILAVSGWFLVE